MSRLTINSNIPSLNAQRSLSNATKKLGDSYTRLSSGLRINKASDDAAGLSISESLKADTRLFNQGVRNLNDGVSLLNIADGALNELSNITIRLRELATQSANGTFSNKQRIALDQEAQSLSKEYNRIARTTEFNGRKIFNGDFGDLSLAAGGSRESLIVGGLGGAIGDGSFVASSSYATGDLPTSVTLGDLNGDGITDLISADNSTNSLSVMIGNGDGTFKSRSSFATGNNPQSVTLGDVNGDGIFDLISADINSSSLSVMIGNGNGSFKSRSSFATVGPSSVVIGDINGDGISDLVSANYTNDSLSVMIGNGNGSFKSNFSFATGSLSSPYKITMGDLNGDGILDLISANQSNDTLSVLIGNGNGSFKRMSSFATGISPESVTLGDLNGDGVFDLISANFGSDSLNVMIGNGDGSFKSRSSFATDSNPSSVILGDLNGDGVSDLVIGHLSASVSVMIGNGNGSFKSRSSFVSGFDSYSVTVGDLNGDGVSDLISMDNGSNTLNVLLGNSNDGVSALQSFSLKTKQDAKSAMDYLSGALTRISKQRGEIGAFQSRLDVATSTLQTSALNYQEANSRITDIDVAEESSRLAATKILQQSAASILAQANQQPRLVLSLLGDL